MCKAVWVLLGFLLAGPAAAQDGVGPPARAPDTGGPKVAPLRLPPPEAFRLFPQLAPDPRVGLDGPVEEHRLLHQQGDPDSLFTLGGPTPEGEVHVKPAIEVNEVFLKAIAPDPLVLPNDARVRAPGSYLPLDREGRPYQLRLGARLVW